MAYDINGTLEKAPPLAVNGIETQQHQKQNNRRSHPVRSLVVDDDDTILDCIANMLTAIGFKKVDIAQRKPEVLKKLTSSPYDLFLTDLEMPDMNGFHLSQMVQKDVYGTKVVIMTGRDKEDCLEMMTAQWVDGWLFKPFGFRELRSTLQSLGL